MSTSLTSVTMDVIPSEVSNAYLSLMSPAKDEQLMVGRFGRLRSSTSKLDPRFSVKDDKSYISHDSYFDVKFELEIKRPLKTSLIYPPPLLIKGPTNNTH